MNLVPTIIEKRENTERAYDIYSRLLEDNIIFIEGEITTSSSNIIISELLYLSNKNKNDINIYINSIGGSVTAGLAIYDTMNYIENDISTICIGISASMAAFLLSSGTKGKRYCLPNSEVMIHQPVGGAQGQATEIKIAAERIIKIKEKISKMLAKNTGQKLEKIKKDTERDYFMNAEEALKYGIIDKIIDNKGKII